MWRRTSTVDGTVAGCVEINGLFDVLHVLFAA